MSAEIGLILPGGENIPDFLELRQVLSTYDGDLRDPLWWPQERPVKIQDSTAEGETSREAPEQLASGLAFPGLPVASQEEALSTGKARGTPGPCQHSKSAPDVSVHSRRTCFPFTASTFKPRFVSHNGGTWDSPVGKPRGKATDPLIHGKGSVTLLLQLGRKSIVHAPTREED